MISIRSEWNLTDSTLAELRGIVAAAEGLPDDAQVRVRVRFGANTEGNLLRRVAVVQAQR
jgi:hypothetical protein